MPWRERSVMDERIRFVISADRKTTSMAVLCQEFGVSRPTGYRWLLRYREAGNVSGFSERSRRPHDSPSQTAEMVVDRIVSLRLAFTWGARKLQILLEQEGLQVSESTINRILKRHGLQHQPEVVGQATTRFARETPNELWQMDFKGPYYMATGRCCPLSIVDDHSRYAVGLYALNDQTARSVHASLVQTFQQYGVPEAILIDHGVPWYIPSGHGLTWLGVAMIKQGIRLCFSGFRHPQTQGKVERFHRTLDDRLRHHGYPSRLTSWRQALDDFVYEYNYIRPHESLGMATPASRYLSSPREYQENPPTWDYPSGATIKRLNTQGQLYWQSRYYFISEALSNEFVEINPCGETLLVRYRHMWIREIDMKTGQSETLIGKPINPYV